MIRKNLASHTVTAVLITLVYLLISTPVESNNTSNQWLATGIVTRVSYDTLYLLGKDDVIYRIDVTNSDVLINGDPGQLRMIQVGDKVRVFGKKTGAKNVKATRLNILETAPVAQITPPEQPQQEPIETEPVVPPTPLPGARDIGPPTGIIPATPPAARLPESGRGPTAVTQTVPSFTGRGLVKDLHLTEGWMTLLTGNGPVSIDIDGAEVTSRGKSTSLSDLSVGDAVYIWGERTATGQVSAVKIDILAEKSMAEAGNPVSAVSATGVIRNLNYPAFTFVMDNSPGFVFVMSDENTEIRSAGGKQLGFSDMRLGMKVKVSGLGSLTTGYLAQQITVIGTKR